ncbi:hypothetical protein [Streptomyces antibioticus]|uniref:hypothetical protein n=1 Tax=Streptomyces antibioticus TaxID=1890 RepID=UPI003F450F26
MPGRCVQSPARPPVLPVTSTRRRARTATPGHGAQSPPPGCRARDVNRPLWRAASPGRPHDRRASLFNLTAAPGRHA